MITTFSDPQLEWHCEPPADGWSLTESGTLQIRPEAETDFWCRTFYTPEFMKANASALVAQIHQEATLETSFTLNYVSQFDQAGAIAYVNDESWCKAGIEFVDGFPRLSVVVTNEFSDWSTQPWHSNSVRLRIHNLERAVVVEAAALDNDQDWHMVRIAKLKAQAPRRLGVFAAAPQAQQGCEATFHYLRITDNVSTVHDANLPATA